MTQKFSKERYLSIDGNRRTVAVWAEKTGVARARILSRLHAGWSPSQAVGLDPGPREQARIDREERHRQAWGEKKAKPHVKHTVYGFTGSMDAVARHFKKSARTLEQRVKRGWSLEEAVAISHLPGKWTIEFARAQPYYHWLMNETKSTRPAAPTGQPTP